MGCDCCPMSNFGKGKCKASLSYRKSVCGVLFDAEFEGKKVNSEERSKQISKETSRRRKKNKNKKTHRK